MVVKMKVVFLCCALLLAGSASCGPVEANSVSLLDGINIPEWMIPKVIGDVDLTEIIQNIIDRLPEVVAAIPDVIERIKEIIEQIVDKIPEVIPIIIDKLPEIIAQIPAIAERIREILETIIDKIPEIIPVIIEKIPAIIEALPEVADKIKQILQDIKEAIEGVQLPDWWPTLPEIPDYRPPTPGVLTAIEDAPGIVQIEIGSAFIWTQGCVGVILNSVNILSSARCFTGKFYDASRRRIRAGSATRYVGGSIIGVDRAIVHPDFTTNTLDGDISIVRLSSVLIFGPTIQQIAIVTQDFTLPEGLAVIVMSWGSTAQGSLVSDRNLYSIDLAVSNKADCIERWSRIPLFTITDNMSCVADPIYGGRNGDVRDIGSPVLYQNIVTHIVSIAAFGVNQRLPIITTNIGPYSDWIVANAV